MHKENQIEFRKFVCPICNAGCGLLIKVKNNKIISVMLDKTNPLSKGYCCPKGIALGYITNDKDRVRRPLKRMGDDFVEISWKQALHEIKEKLTQIRDKFGANAIGYYMGTNSLNNYAHSMFVTGFMSGLGSRNLYNAGSVDNNNLFVAQHFLFGNSIVMPIPDLPNTDLLIIIGSNPAVTNLSLVTCANVIKVLKGIKNKGGEIYVIDPRRNETAKMFAKDDEYYILIYPNTVILLLFSMINIILKEELEDKEFLKKNTVGYEKLKELFGGFTPEIVEKFCRIPADKIYKLTHKFVKVRKSVIYGRLGICLSEFSTLNAWAVYTLNIIAGKLDRPGGLIFGYNVINIAKLGKLIGIGGFNRYRSRVGNYPDVMGAFPVGSLAREIMFPINPIKALIISAGNPALSAPNSNEFEMALKKLDLCVVLDFYINETALIAADYILPVNTPLENSNYSIFSLNYHIFPHIDYTPPIVISEKYAPKPEWEILLALTRLLRLKFMNNNAFNLILKFFQFINKKFDPEIIVRIFLFLGQIFEKRFPYLSKNALTFRKLKKNKFIITGKNEYNVIKKYLQTKNKKINFLNSQIIEQINLCYDFLKKIDKEGKNNEFVLIGGRMTKSMNSWMHNVEFLWKKNQIPKLLINSNDAKKLNLRDDDLIKIKNTFGSIIVPIKLSEDIMQGVLFYPHGWGHRNPKLSVADRHPGENVNKLTDSHKLEKLSGIPLMNGYKV
ncbi:MAG: molybdopterin-containing oxidoreductase family protein, partial [Candidatus Helarchaeota archaeon]